ncbi:MAG: FKBP-type peptidyl-prolyl cis-trans isomerase [Bacteroidales bacterium]|nr:FKBP-type peptidyl-prolyl cis-trans isomerase [Bacteroidales bacterium]
MKRIFYAAVLLTLAVVIVSCNPAKKYEEEEKSQIADYIASHYITVSPDSKGLYYMETVPGTGDLIKSGDSVGVYYTLMFLNHEVLQSNVEEDTPYRFRVGSYELIEGWAVGLTKMKLGGKARLLIPSILAYGSMGYGHYYYGYYYTIIPGYTPLIYDIEVVELVRARK